MSEVTSRPSASRGRGSGRGGRGGFAGRGGRRTNGDHKASADDNTGAFDDEGDFAELRKQYGGKTSVIREMFPDWSEADVLFALQETNGDENEAVTRIADGSISQWGEVSKPKKTTRTKAKDTTAAPSTNDAAASRPVRGGRVVSEGGRGRGRATDRGGRGGRGRSTQPTTNGSRQKENQQLSIPTEESSAWGNETAKAEISADKGAEQPIAAPEVTKPAAPQSKTWASMLRQSTAPKVAPKPKEAPAPKPAEPTESLPIAEPAQPEPEPPAAEEETTPVVAQATLAQPTVVEPEVAIPPSQDELTRTNLEQNPVSATATPISAAQQQHQAPRQASSGYAAAALKATTDRTTRPASFQRRVLDQEEAVRMPGNREVDRAAVQFGAFNLNGGEEDIDGEREEPETRAQPPADSPIAPRAALPPVSQPAAAPESFQQKPMTGPPGVPAPAGISAPGPASQAPGQVPQPALPSQQYGRFGQGGPQDSAAAAAQQKPLDPFSQQNAPASQPPFDNFGNQTSQAQSQQPGGAFTSAPSDYSSYYTANQQERTPYSYYGQQFGQQGAQGQQDGAPSQQRPFGGYNASQQGDSLSQYPQSGAAHNQPRFGGAGTDSQNSGHNTPNPTAQSQHQQPQPQAAQQQGGPGSQPQSHGQQYPGYNHPYYSNPYYHQYYSGYGQGNFGPYGKGGGMYGQPYGVSPNAPYDHASSPASFGQSSAHRDSGIGSSLGEYGRAGSAQTGGAPGLGGSSFGSVHDSFSRGSSAFQSQGQSFNSPAQPAAGASTDDLKPFGDAKPGSGPSPALGGARPGSAANSASAGQGLPPPQNSQMGGGYGGYPSHLQGHGVHGNNAYGMGGAAGANQHGNSPYGSYSQGGFGSGGYYGGNQQQQQQRGWGGNYH